MIRTGPLYWTAYGIFPTWWIHVYIYLADVGGEATSILAGLTFKSISFI
jgi:hypothetical protein